MGIIESDRKGRVFMHTIVRLLIVLAIFGLNGCTKFHGKHSENTACQAQCSTMLEQCTKSCRNNCPSCAYCADSVAAKDYMTYKRRQCVQGGLIARDLQSYRDPLQCRKMTCDCQKDYSVCMQSCSGLIHKRLQVQPKCC